MSHSHPISAGPTLTRRRLLALTAGLLLLPALGGCSDKGHGPVPTKWGKEYCAYCGMLVDDPRFAAQVRANGKVNKFDDLGDAILWMDKQKLTDDMVAEFWVGDCERGEWIDGRQAWYLGGKKSPMAHNWGAVPDRRDGALSYAEMKQKVLERGSTSRCETPDPRSS